MKTRSLLILFSAICLCLLCFLFSWLKVQYDPPVPIPSVPGGYYEEPVLLEFDVPAGGTIYYTTDGSTPTIKSQVYDKGILINNRSDQPNRIHAVQNVIPDWKNYEPTPDPVCKGTVIRAIYVNARGMSSDVFTQTYFVGIQPPKQGYTLSLIFEFDDFFGDNGIYVTGKEYDQWYLSDGAVENMPVANFNKDLEVMAIAEFMDSRSNILQQSICVRLQGNTAREEIKKRFTLVARPEYSGSETFQYPFFDGVTTHSVMIKGYLPDAMVYDFLQDRSLALQKSVPVRVFLNGEYLYDSYMLERFDSHYFRQYHQVEERILVKNGITDEDSLFRSEVNYYDEFMYWIEHTDFSDPDEWAAFLKEADLQSYLDFLVANYFFCNIDYNDLHNHVLWRNAPETAKKNEDTRWKWCIYDIDALAWVQNDPSRGKAYQINVFNNDFSMDMHDSAIFRSLRRNDEFCRHFVLTFMDMLNNNFSVANAEKILSKYGYSLSWTDHYFEKRPEWAVKHLAEEFGLTGTLETVMITTGNPEMGHIVVNTSQIELSDGSWSGQYFTDYPITVTAIPNDGYKFLGWKGDADTTADSVTVCVDGGVTLEAVFAGIE